MRDLITARLRSREPAIAQREVDVFRLGSATERAQHFENRVPQLAPVLIVNLVLITIASFNTFDLIIPLTGGGPARQTEVISLFMYRLGFFDLDAGRAAAVAVAMLGVNLSLAWVAGRLILRGTTDAAVMRSAA